RVLRSRIGLVDEARRGEACDRVLDRRRVDVEIAPDRRLADEAGPVRVEEAERDLFAERVLGTEARKPRRHRLVEVELALLDELSDRDRGEELRDGAEPRERAERERPVRARVLAYESARIDDLALVDEHDRETRDALRIHLSLDRRIERPRDRLVSIDRPEASLGALVGASDGGGDDPGAQTEEDSETCSKASQGGDIRSSASRARPSYESFKHGKLS